MEISNLRENKRRRQTLPQLSASTLTSSLFFLFGWAMWISSLSRSASVSSISGRIFETVEHPHSHTSYHLMMMMMNFISASGLLAGHGRPTNTGH